MLQLERGGYTEQEIKDAIHAKYSARNVRFRYNLLDKYEEFIRVLDNVIGAEISMASFDTIKRKAKFKLIDNNEEINYLSDRIQPIMELKVKTKRHYKANNLSPQEMDSWSNNNCIVEKRVERLEGQAIYRITFKAGVLSRVFFDFPYFKNDNFKGKISYKFVSGTESPPGFFFRETGFGQTHVSKTFPASNNWSTLDLEKTFSVNGSSMFLLYRSNGATTEDIVIDFSMPQLEKNVDAFNVFGVGEYNLQESYTDESFIEFPLGIFLLNSPKRLDKDGVVYRDVEAYDGTIVLRDDRFESRYTIVAGTNYRTAVIDILLSAGITKHNIEQTDKTVTNDIEFEPGKEKLYAINELLRHVNYNQMIVDVNGYYLSKPYVSPSSRASEYTYKDDKLSIMYSEMEEELDLFNMYNKWVVVLSNPESDALVSTYTNENVDNPLSTVNRGRTIVDYREVDNIADQQSLDAYVQRIAFESSQVFGRIEFSTAINPIHDYNDILQVEYSPLGINDKYSEVGWSMSLEAGARMKHELRKVVQI